MNKRISRALASLAQRPLLVGAALVAVALCVRLAAVWLAGDRWSNIVTHSESGIVAANVLAGRGFIYDFYGQRPDAPLHAFIPPLYVALIYGALALAAQPEPALYVAQAVLSALACGGIYMLALNLSRRQRVALLAGVAAVFYPPAVAMVIVPESTTLHFTLLVWSLALTVYLAQRPRLITGAAAGVAWGLLLLGRPAFLYFLPLLPLWFRLNRPALPEQRRRLAAGGGALAAALLAVVLPWTVRNYAVLGDFVPVSTNGGLVFWSGNNPFTIGSGHEVFTAKVDEYLGRPHNPAAPPVMLLQPYPMPHSVGDRVATLPETELDAALYRAGLEYMRSEPGAWLALVGHKLTGFWWFRRNMGNAYPAAWLTLYRPVYALLLLVTVAGLLLSLRAWRRYSLVYAVFAFSTLIALAFAVLTRFRWEIEPLFLVFAALALSAALDFVTSRLRYGVQAQQPAQAAALFASTDAQAAGPPVEPPQHSSPA